MKKFKSPLAWLDPYLYVIRKKLESRRGALTNLSISNNEMLIGHDTVTTNYCIRKYLRIVEFPKQVPEELFAELREAVQSSLPRDMVAHVNFNVKMKPHFIDFNDKNMLLRKNIWSERIAESEQEINADGSPMKTTKQSAILENDKWLIESWDFFLKAVNNNEATPVAEFFAEVVIYDTTIDGVKALDTAVQAFLRRSSSLFVKWQVISSGFWSSLWDFFKYFTPLGSSKDTVMPVDTTEFPVTTRFVANLSDYTQGTLSGKEVPLGKDIITNQVVYKDLGISGEAENIAIIGGTGSGKSYLNKNFQCASMASGYTCIIMDRDGEYIDICKNVDGLILSFAQGIYFDTMEIADLTGDVKVDCDLYNDSLLATQNFFHILCSTETATKMNPMELKTFSLALNNLQHLVGVDPDNKETWVNSKDSRYCFKGLYEQILLLRENNQLEGVDMPAYEEMLAKLELYFSPTGMFRHRFKQALSTKDILGAIQKGCGFIDMNLHIPDDEKGASKETRIKFVQANHLISVILAYNHKNQEFTMVTYEEINRFTDDDEACVSIAAAATGNRKRNAITIFNCNTPSVFVGASAHPSLVKVKQNLNYVILGRFTNEDTQDTASDIASNFGFTDAVDGFIEMNSRPLYKHCFMLRDSRTKEVAFIKVPPIPGYEYLFATRSTKELTE